MQQAGSMFPVMPSFPPTNITTEQIQQYLDENKKLILAILDNQNLGKLAECAQYQAQLQKNLMYLAAIADAQPQTPAMPSQMTPPHPAMQQGGFYMQQHPQAAAMAQQQQQQQQQSIFLPRPPFNTPHPLQDPQQHQHNQQTAMRSVGLNNGMNDANLGSASTSLPTSNSNLNDIRGGSKEDRSDSRAAAGSDGADAEEAK